MYTKMRILVDINQKSYIFGVFFKNKWRKIIDIVL